MPAALDNLVNSGMLKAEASSKTELRRFIAHAERALKDAGVPGVSATAIDAPNTLASTLNRYHTRRNRSEYVAFEEASEAEATELLALARQTHGLLIAWLRRHRPQLL